jgi:Glycosyltransferases involved in cell wall biogenesis
MAKYKTCVYAICKNEEKYVDQWMDSMEEADLVVVTDTGSEDGTVDKLRERGAVVYVDEVKPWRFDKARNISLDHVPEDVDICVCTDLDELFEKGWKERLDQAWTPDARQGKYIYNWSLKPDGSPDVQIYYSKVHSRHGFRWNYPVHEWLQYMDEAPRITVFIEGMVLNHYPDNAKSRGSYLPLLELAVQEDPQGDRVTYYLGREYMYKGQWQKCIETLKRHLSLPTATWSEERCASMRWIAKSNYELGNVKEAYSWYFRAIAEAPHMRDPYVECAKIAYFQADWPMVYFMVEEALKIKEKSKVYVNMGYAWDHTPDDLGAISAFRLGIFGKSIEHAEKALQISPNDERLKLNLQLIKEKLAESSSTA